VRLVGGCCGVGPQHIAAVDAIREELTVGLPQAASALGSDDDHPRALEHPLLTALHGGGFPVCTLLAARLDAQVAERAACTLAEAGAAAVGLDPGWPGSSAIGGLPARLRYIADRAECAGVLALDPWAIDTAAAQDLLISAHLLGIRSVVVDTGLFSAGGDEPGGCGPENLVRLITRLNQGRDAGGSRLDVRTELAVGVRLRLEAMGDLALWRECGADFASVQPVYEPKRFRAAMRSLGDELPVLAEILVLPDAATADELDNEVPSLSVPTRLRERLHTHPDEDIEGVLRFLRAWRDRLAGAILLLPDERTGAAVKVLRGMAAAAVDEAS